MKKISEPIIFFGNERLATGVNTEVPTLRALIGAGYNIAAVVSNYERSRSRNVHELEIAQVAEAYNIPTLLPQKLGEIKEQLRSFNAVVAVLVAYGKIVPQSIIDLFPQGIVNIHPSLLPLHRGPIPVESVILESASETGISIMQLVKEMDAGPVYKQSRVSLTGNETKQQLADQLLELGKDILLNCLPSIIDGSLSPVPQDNTLATYDSLLEKEDGTIDWQKPADQLEREIRAFAEWPKSRTTLAGKDVIITKAHILPDQPTDSKPGDVEMLKDTGVITITTAEGSLCIDTLKPAGKREMSTAEFLAGYGKEL